MSFTLLPSLLPALRDFNTVGSEPLHARLLQLIPVSQISCYSHFKCFAGLSSSLCTYSTQCQMDIIRRKSKRDCWFTLRHPWGGCAKASTWQPKGMLKCPFGNQNVCKSVLLGDKNTSSSVARTQCICPFFFFNAPTKVCAHHWSDELQKKESLLSSFMRQNNQLRRLHVSLTKLCGIQQPARICPALPWDMDPPGSMCLGVVRLGYPLPHSWLSPTSMQFWRTATCHWRHCNLFQCPLIPIMFRPALSLWSPPPLFFHKSLNHVLSCRSLNGNCLLCYLQ